MKLRDIAKTAWSNLTRHPVRTALTTIGVIVGILTIVTMVSLGIGVQSEMRKTFDNVGLESVRLYPSTDDTGSYQLFGEPERTKLLTPELAQSLQDREDVLAVTPYLRLPYSLRMSARLDGREAQALPWGPQPGFIAQPFTVVRETLAGNESPPESGGGAVLGQGLLTNLGYGPEDAPALVGQKIEIWLNAPRGDSQAFELDITGVTDHQQSSVALALPDRLEMLEWWYNDPDYLAHRGYDELFVQTESLSDAARIVDWLTEEGYEVQSLKLVLDMANRGMVIMQTMLASVGALALLVASIGIANTMIMAVYERTREIGVLKAVGAAPGQIRTLFVVEAALIGLLGGIIGTVLGWLLGKALNLLILEILRWQEINVQGTFFVVSWWLVLAALAFATLIGLLAGLYPAARAAKLAPLEALRYE